MTGYSDNIISNVFEGISLNFNFTQNQLFGVLQSVRDNLVKPFTHEYSYEKMYGARFLQRPLLVIDQIVKSKTKPESKKAKTGMPRLRNQPKYMLFSGHDTNVGNLWAYLQPINFKQDNLLGQFVEWYQIPYASSI